MGHAAGRHEPPNLGINKQTTEENKMNKDMQREIARRVKAKIDQLPKAQLANIVMAFVENLFHQSETLSGGMWQVDDHVTVKEWDSELLDTLAGVLYMRKLTPSDILSETEIQRIIDDVEGAK
jgi:hypothetical protein